MTDKTPAQREADQDPTVEVDWDGVKITAPAVFDDLDLDAMEAFEQGKALACAKAIVVDFDKKRREYEKVNGRRPKVRDLSSLMDALGSAWGFENQGN